MDTTLAHWVAQIRAAAQHKQTLVIQGGNSKSFYGETATSANVLDTRAHSGIVSYEPSELVVTVRAGTPLAELEAVFPTDFPWLCPLGCKLAVFLRLCRLILPLPLRAHLGLVQPPAAAL